MPELLYAAGTLPEHFEIEAAVIVREKEVRPPVTAGGDGVLAFGN